MSFSAQARQEEWIMKNTEDDKDPAVFVDWLTEVTLLWAFQRIERKRLQWIE